MSSSSNSDFKVAVSSAASIECTNTAVSSEIGCSFPIEITSLADSPKTLSGKFFALVDGKIYLADTSYGGIDSISETWNPGESNSGVVPFLVPANSRISSIFLGPEDSSSIDDAVLSLTVNVKAVDGWTPEVQQRLLEMTKVDNLVSRLTESSGYPWKSNGSVDSADANLFVTIEIDVITTDIPVVLNCFSFVASKDELAPVFPTYEDTESGLHIQYQMGNKDCLRIFESTPGIKKVK
jgi:hypothetical protein